MCTLEQFTGRESEGFLMEGIPFVGSHDMIHRDRVLVKRGMFWDNEL